jgi:hypothetical protein
MILIMRPDRYCAASADAADTNSLAHISELMQAHAESTWG